MGKSYKRWKRRHKNESATSEPEPVVEKRVIPKKIVKEEKKSIWTGTLGQ